MNLGIKGGLTVIFGTLALTIATIIGFPKENQNMVKKFSNGTFTKEDVVEVVGDIEKMREIQDELSDDEIITLSVNFVDQKLVVHIPGEQNVPIEGFYDSDINNHNNIEDQIFFEDHTFLENQNSTTGGIEIPPDSVRSVNVNTRRAGTIKPQEINDAIELGRPVTNGMVKYNSPNDQSIPCNVYSVYSVEGTNGSGTEEIENSVDIWAYGMNNKGDGDTFVTRRNVDVAEDAEYMHGEFGTQRIEQQLFENGSKFTEATLEANLVGPDIQQFKTFMNTLSVACLEG